METKPLTAEAIALTEKKMDMTLGIFVLPSFTSEFLADMKKYVHCFHCN